MMHTKSIVAAIALAIAQTAITPAYADVPADVPDAVLRLLIMRPWKDTGLSWEDGQKYFQDLSDSKRKGPLLSFRTLLIKGDSSSAVAAQYSVNCKTHQFVVMEGSNGRVLFRWPDNGQLHPRPKKGSPLDFVITATCKATALPPPATAPYHATEVEYLVNP